MLPIGLPALGRLAAMAVLLPAAVGASHQPAAAPPPPNGVLLVARPELSDPNFRRTVVLVTRHAHGGAVGVILNRPTAVPLKEVFPAHPHLAARADVLYRGGPVSGETLVFVFRSSAPPPNALRVLEDVYMSLDRGLLEAMVARPDPGELRVYAGYAGWAPGQLEAEIHHGGWHVLDADPTTIFRADPQTLWPTLLRRATSRSAGLPPRRPGPA
jgi:putative transcriptional regulator